MRLLYVCSDLGIDPRGTKGASIHLRAITQGLAGLGHDVRLLSPYASDGAAASVRDLLDESKLPARDTIKELKRWLDDRDLDDSPAGEFQSLAYQASASQRAREALAANPPDAVVERLSLFGHVGLDLAEAFDVPLILEINAPLTAEASIFRSLHLRTLAAKIEHRVLEQADELLVVSSALARRFESKGFEANRIHVVPNGVDLSMYEALPDRDACRQLLGIHEEYVVGFAGSLKVWHGVDTLVSAFARIARRGPNSRLLIIGSGPEESQLIELVERLGIAPQVTFTGAVPHDRVPQLLRACDVAAAPFRNVEDFYFSPIKLFEYMASGACVVASRLGQIREVIQENVNGLLCHSDDVDDLAAKLEEVRRSPELGQQLAAEARSEVEQNYTWSHTAQVTARVIEEAVAWRKCCPRSLFGDGEAAPKIAVAS